MMKVYDNGYVGYQARYENSSVVGYYANMTLNGSAGMSVGGDGAVGGVAGESDDLGEDSLQYPDPAHRYVILVSYLATFLFGLAGNTLVIYIIAYFSKVRQKSVANYYIWNLAFADELYIFALPLFCYSTFTRDWPFGSVACKIAYLLRDINKFASVYTLVALSIDRYLATFHRLAYLRTVQVGKIICISIWGLCFLLSTPFYTVFAHTVENKQGRTSCRLVWPEGHSMTYMRFWTYFQFVVGLIWPFGLICVSYVLLARRFRLLVKMQANSRIKKSGRRMTQTVIVVVLTFLFCQAPYYIMNIVNLNKAEQYKDLGLTSIPHHDRRTFGYINGVVQILVFVSSCCNPIIYALLNENFRQLCSIVSCRFHRGAPTVDEFLPADLDHIGVDINPDLDLCVSGKLYSIVLCRCRRGAPTADEFKDMEVDGQYIPIQLKVKVTFHLPCTCLNPLGTRRKRVTHTSAVVDTDTDGQQASTSV